jgi:intracellular sulfur oxidation DsrE/DsrF family protein
MSAVHNRRSFMSALASVAGLAAFDHSAPAAGAQTPAPAKSKWDLTWLEQIKGQHRQVYDYGSFDLAADPLALRFVGNYFDAHKEVSALETPEINAIAGIMFTSFPINASDALWEKYKLGERWNIVDPKTKQPSVRNLYLEDTMASPGIKRLQARGTTFWQCNVALGRVTMTLAQATQISPATVRAELIAGLNPGVRLVPSHVMAVGLAQELGFTYVKP